MRLVLFEFYHHNLDGLGSRVDVGVELAGRVGREPVGMAGVPLMCFGGTALGHDLHRSAAQRDDDAPVVVAMQRQRSVGYDHRFPDANSVVFKLRKPLRLDLLLGAQSDRSEKERGDNENDFHDERLYPRNAPTYRNFSCQFSITVNGGGGTVPVDGMMKRWPSGETSN